MKKLLFLLVVVLVAGGWWLRKAAEPVVISRPMMVEIQPGAGVPAIAGQLAAAGVLRSRWPLLAWHFLRPTRQYLQAGEYQFSGRLSPAQVYNKLARGEVFYHLLTIPEGYNIFDAADAVERSGLASGKDFLEAARDPAPVADLAPGARNLEGFLFPDTYYFPRRAGAKQIVMAMVAHFRQVYTQLGRLHALRAGRVLEVVTLASLVEKETSKSDERPLVAGVYQNRLKAGVLLACDPTVIYAALLEGKYRGTIYLSDLKRDHPYNTYLRQGLPPGPIANPGRAALEAALAPAETRYMYFVSDAEGGHVFSRTLSEHNRHVAVYRRRMRRTS
jgi:UPF0755 protein